MQLCYFLVSFLLLLPCCASIKCYECFGIELFNNKSNAEECLYGKAHNITPCRTLKHCSYVYGCKETFPAALDPVSSIIMPISCFADSSQQLFALRGCAVMEHCKIAASIPYTKIKSCNICENNLCNTFTPDSLGTRPGASIILLLIVMIF